MLNTKEERENRLTWQLRSLAISNEMAGIGLAIFWAYAIDKVDEDQVDFENLFCKFSKVLHMVQVLELQPLVKEEDKKKLATQIELAMDNKATHDVLYETQRKGEHLKDQMIAWLKVAVEKHLDYFENIEANIGKTLNEPYWPSDGDDHPLEELLDRRDRIGWIVIGLYLMHAEDKYMSIDVDYIGARFKRLDLLLRHKILVCVTDFYKDYREPVPYAPADFWWRRIPGHEYQIKE